MKQDDEMYTSLFSDPLSRNETGVTDNEMASLYRGMEQENLRKEVESWMEWEYEGDFGKDRENPESSLLNLSKAQHNSTIGCLVRELDRMLLSENINPDFFAGAISNLADIRTCSCCLQMSEKAENLLRKRAEKAFLLLDK